MPIGAVGRSVHGDVLDSELQVICTSRVVESNSARVKVDAIRNVMPDTRFEGDIPLALPAGIPLQLLVHGALFAGDETIFHLREVRLKEADLMLLRSGRGVGSCMLHREMVEHFPLVDGGVRLGNQLRAQHTVAVPGRCFVDSDLDAVGIAVRWVLVVRANVDIIAGRPITVNVVSVPISTASLSTRTSKATYW